MTWDEAIKESIRYYFDKGDDSLTHTEYDKDRKYTKKYFDDFEDEILNNSNAVDKTKHKDNKKPTNSDIDKFNKKIS